MGPPPPPCWHRAVLLDAKQSSAGAGDRGGETGPTSPVRHGRDVVARCSDSPARALGQLPGAHAASPVCSQDTVELVWGEGPLGDRGSCRGTRRARDVHVSPELREETGEAQGPGDGRVKGAARGQSRLQRGVSGQLSRAVVLTLTLRGQSRHRSDRVKKKPCDKTARNETRVHAHARWHLCTCECMCQRAHTPARVRTHARTHAVWLHPRRSPRALTL